MTAEQRASATERLCELKRKELLPPETLNDLQEWWRSVLRREQNKVVSIAEWQRMKLT